MTFATRVLAVLVAITATSSAAFAGGGDDPPPPDRCGPGPFSGAYIGATAGYIRADAEQTALNNGAHIEADDSGWAIGGHVGYQRQCGRAVFGVEADISWMDADSTGLLYDDGLLVTETTSSYSHFATLRGRMGLAHDNVLFYLTGGLAFASIDRDLSVPPLDFHQSDRDREVGWTIGGGIELVRDNRWSMRAEVLYVDLGEEPIHYTRTGCPACEARVRWEDDFIVARLGFSLKLHREEPRHEPLK